ncbi:carbohydrate-binding module family 48 protein [Cercophora newfieldiana]|uniref:Carbohydrate-binding module family 48 protein n=1 Tax=Cercophora newfieldiana TaxID=92897 RepID=A0AA39YFN7_9PEZI|nr:carbohydrate-binding module family 48 protein [Cercophora newfieldiana]
MGNNPSTNRPVNPSSASQLPGQNDSARPVRRDNRHPIPVHNQRVAAPPEQSFTLAQGTAVQPPQNNRPKSLPPRAIPSHNNSPAPSMTAPSSVSSASRPLDVRPKPSEPPHEPSKPVAVPYPHNNNNSPSPPRSSRPDSYEASHVPMSSLQDISYLTRPPRLPLPIDEEVHTPGSPIIAPTDVGQPLDDDASLDPEGLQRPPSNLSNSSTLEDEEVDELLVDKNRPTVPTRLEWRRGGDKVYVTGTIFQWNRKTPLHPVEGQPGVFAATINILPGTHHIRFLVDNQMQTSPDLPTTVDFGNNLVNYIEVNPDDVLSDQPEAPGKSTGKDGQPSAQAKQTSSEEQENKKPKDREIPPPNIFHHKIPKYLLDFDQPEDTPPYHSAISAIDKLPNPPTLPGFLGKPILNAATLIKDDNSVLNMPNHTVLNHLATSSIKNNILAVSATTRYKSKYVTTIMYKPTTADA